MNQMNIATNREIKQRHTREHKHNARHKHNLWAID